MNRGKVTEKDFVPGARLFLARGYAHDIREVEVVQGPHATNNGTKGAVRLRYLNGRLRGHDMLEFLGDMGVRPYAYDDRPTQAHRTLRSARKNFPKARNWLVWARQNDPE